MKSRELFEQAKTLMPGGVSSPVRAIKPYPFYTARAEGPHLTTVDGATLIDCCMAYGPLLLGHAHPEIKKAIAARLDKGWLYGTPIPEEPEFARLITGDHPGMDMARFVSSGSEATMAAIRLARGFTGKSDIVRIEGGFHGAHDAVLVKAGSGATTMGVPDSAGVLADLVAHTRQLPYNDPEALETLLAKNTDIAALIIEPVLGNIGPVIPKDGYLKDVREITKAHRCILREARDHVTCRAAGPGLPGRYLLGKSSLAFRRDRDDPLAARSPRDVCGSRGEDPDHRRVPPVQKERCRLLCQDRLDVQVLLQESSPAELH